MKTYFASPERSSGEIIQKEHVVVDKVAYAHQIMDAMPCLSVILNKDRQIIYANEALISLLGINGMDKALGLRPGELVSCIHSCKMPGGCGTAEACRHCGAVNTIIKCMQTHEKEASECRITSAIGQDQLVSFEFQITCTPFDLGEDRFVIMTLTDISGEKRRKLLETTFLHDLSNQTNNLNGLTYMIQKADATGRLGQLINILSTVSGTINDEILSYKQLISAENNALPVNNSEVKASDVVEMVVQSVLFNEVSAAKDIIQDCPKTDVILDTDVTLLQRVLLNMLKNALEASAPGETVRIGYTLQDNQTVTFYVNNNNVMPDHVKSQIFQRSFSTKGEGRGIGTYSMKLLGERYLKGNVGFESISGKGTRFYLTLKHL
ncbi:MAG: HAMP domain-containing histidine kinase [Bacteroidales bacterium]|jgi:hypothetical protein|nr:HAMP domain-containing histidine kinase [Bacteroidales bacterium]